MRPRLTLALAALAVASVANFGLQFAHVRDASIMVLAWHLGAAAVLVGVGRMARRARSGLAPSSERSLMH